MKFGSVTSSSILVYVFCVLAVTSWELNAAESVSEALLNGEAIVDVRVRYEFVD